MPTWLIVVLIVAGVVFAGLIGWLMLAVFLRSR